MDRADKKLDRAVLAEKEVQTWLRKLNVSNS